MGDPKKPRKKYSTPGHPWIKERIDKERGIIKVYGLKNKKEIWKSESVLKRFREQAKRLISDVTEQGKKEEKQLLSKLIRLGLVKDGCKIEDILDLGLEDILEKRLQTLVFKKDLAKSIKQARQFVIHGHINIGDRKVDIPSYLVSLEEEGMIGFNPGSELANIDHPERFVKVEKKIIKEEKKPKEVKEKTKKSLLKKKVSKKKEKLSVKGPKETVPKAEDLVKKKEKEEKVDVEKLLEK